MYNPKLFLFKTRCVHINLFTYLVMCALIVPIIASANTETYFCDGSTNSELRYNNTVILKKYEDGNLASIQEVKNKKIMGYMNLGGEMVIAVLRGGLKMGVRMVIFLHGIKMEEDIFQGA